MKSEMFRITMRADGISLDIGAAAALDIESEFCEHRPWHEQVSCSFSNGTLTLVALTTLIVTVLRSLTNFPTVSRHTFRWTK